MTLMLYKEKGGINWSLCRVIAEYKGKIWLHNIHAGSMPMGRKAKYEFAPLPTDVNDILNPVSKEVL